MPSQFLQGLYMSSTEVEGQRKAFGIAVKMIAQGLFQALVEIIQGQPVKRLAGQFADGAHRGNHPVAAGFSQ